MNGVETTLDTGFGQMAEDFQRPRRCRRCREVGLGSRVRTGSNDPVRMKIITLEIIRRRLSVLSSQSRERTNSPVVLQREPSLR